MRMGTRGMGPLQQRIVDVLNAADGQKLASVDVARRCGPRYLSPDGKRPCSAVTQAIGALKRRGLLVVTPRRDGRGPYYHLKRPKPGVRFGATQGKGWSHV